MTDLDYKRTVPNLAFVPSKTVNQASEVDMDYCAQLVVRAGRYLEIGKVGAAENILRQGLERVPEHPECLAYLAVCLAAGKRKFVTAEKLAKNIIKNHPYDPTAWYALGRVNLLGGRREQAFNNFEKAKRVSRGDIGMEIIIEKMDPRQDAVLEFLPRDHFLNIMLGRLRVKFGL